MICLLGRNSVIWKSKNAKAHFVKGLQPQASNWVTASLSSFTLRLFQYTFTQDRNVKKEMRGIWKSQWKGQLGSNALNKRGDCGDNWNKFYGSMSQYFLGHSIFLLFSYNLIGCVDQGFLFYPWSFMVELTQLLPIMLLPDLNIACHSLELPVHLSLKHNLASLP